jgi:hypothetical protein
MNVSLVTIDQIENIWPLIEKYLDGAAKYTHGRFKVEDIRNRLYTAPQQLWIAYEDLKVYGAVVTEITQYPQMTSLVMHFTGGEDLPKWKDDMLHLLQRFAKDQGCAVIESYGRPGWEKVFKNDGFKSRFMFYELPVEKEA